MNYSEIIKEERISIAYRWDKTREEGRYHYDLLTPFALSRDQMELIMNMIRQMKISERPFPEALSLLYPKEE